MTEKCWGVLGLWLLVTVVVLSGCAAGGVRRSAGSADAYISPLPPALQGTDPALRQWYTPPYFDPYEMP
jgi:hypothetical protein